MIEAVLVHTHSQTRGSDSGQSKLPSKTASTSHYQNIYIPEESSQWALSNDHRWSLWTPLNCRYTLDASKSQIQTHSFWHKIKSWQRASQRSQPLRLKMSENLVQSAWYWYENAWGMLNRWSKYPLMYFSNRQTRVYWMLNAEKCDKSLLNCCHMAQLDRPAVMQLHYKKAISRPS